MRDPELLVADIMKAIEHIERYAGRGRDEFDHDELLQIWMIHHIQVIGEAVRELPDEFRARFPQIPWNQIVGMRHTLVHRYFGIDLDIVWDVVENKLPELERDLIENRK